MNEQLSFLKTLDTDTEQEKPLTDRPINCVHCLFEQSGTFKNEFRKLGYKAYDYDILNEFSQTDYQIDLFSEINNAYENKPSIFDSISEQDLILCFFPCVRFENQIMLFFRGQAKQFKNWTMQEKMKYDMRLMDELSENYHIVNKLFILCMDRGLRMVMENPYSKEHFLQRYWCYPPEVIDRDRRENGDYYAKPTQYWFVGFKPKNNLIMEQITYNDLGGGDAIRSVTKEQFCVTGAKEHKVARSMIHPDYANRFIRQYLIDKED